MHTVFSNLGRHKPLNCQRLGGSDKKSSPTNTYDLVELQITGQIYHHFLLPRLTFFQRAAQNMMLHRSPVLTVLQMRLEATVDTALINTCFTWAHLLSDSWLSCSHPHKNGYLCEQHTESQNLHILQYLTGDILYQPDDTHR